MDNVSYRVEAMIKFNAIRNDLERQYARGRISYEDMQRILNRARDEFSASMERYKD